MRRYTMIPCSLKGDPRFRAASPGAQWLYFHLLLEPELTPAGTLRVNLPALAAGTVGTGVDDINRALDELAAAGLILRDAETFELWITDYMGRDPARRSRNARRAVVIAIEALMSERLVMAVLESLPADFVADEMPQSVMPSQTLREGFRTPSPSLVEGVPVLEQEQEPDLRAVLQAFWHSRAAASTDAEDPESAAMEARVQEAITLLAQRRVAEAPLSRTLLGCLEHELEDHGGLAGVLVADHPDWSADRVADAIDLGAFGA